MCVGLPKKKPEGDTAQKTGARVRSIFTEIKTNAKSRKEKQGGSKRDLNQGKRGGRMAHAGSDKKGSQVVRGEKMTIKKSAGLDRK